MAHRWSHIGTVTVDRMPQNMVRRNKLARFVIGARFIVSLGRVVAGKTVVEPNLVDDIIAVHDSQTPHHGDTLVIGNRSPALSVRVVLDPQLIFHPPGRRWLRYAWSWSTMTS